MVTNNNEMTPIMTRKRLLNILVSSIGGSWLECQSMTTVYLCPIPEHVCQHVLSVFLAMFAVFQKDNKKSQR
jgi:hypothetical protein